MASDANEQKEYLDQNLENLNQAFNQIQDKIEELDVGQNNGNSNDELRNVIEEVDNIK